MPRGHILSYARKDAKSTKGKPFERVSLWNPFPSTCGARLPLMRWRALWIADRCANTSSLYPPAVATSRALRLRGGCCRGVVHHSLRSRTPPPLGALGCVATTKGPVTLWKPVELVAYHKWEYREIELFSPIHGGRGAMRTAERDKWLRY